MRKKCMKIYGISYTSIGAINSTDLFMWRHIISIPSSIMMKTLMLIFWRRWVYTKHWIDYVLISRQGSKLILKFRNSTVSLDITWFLQQEIRNNLIETVRRSVRHATLLSTIVLLMVPSLLEE